MKISRCLLFLAPLALVCGQAWSTPVAGKLPWHERADEREHSERYAYRQEREGGREHGREHAEAIYHGKYDDPLPEHGANGTAVFETTSIFRNTTFFTESFLIETGGTYQAVLTDFEFPVPLWESALNITTASDTLATLLGPGTVTFEAEPGEYYVSFFAVAGRGKPEHGHMSWREWAGRHERAKDEGWREWMAERHDGLPWNKHPWHHGRLGQYGIEISLVTAVPIPASAWLLGAGLVGLGGVGWRRRRSQRPSDSASIDRYTW